MSRLFTTEQALPGSPGPTAISSRMPSVTAAHSPTPSPPPDRAGRGLQGPDRQRGLARGRGAHSEGEVCGTSGRLIP